MSSKIRRLFTLPLILWLNICHAPHATAFFDYNKFHPVPYRPDLQEYCPQVGIEQPIQLVSFRQIVSFNSVEMKLVKETEFTYKI